MSFRIIKDPDGGGYYIGCAITECPVESPFVLYPTKEDAMPSLREIQAADQRFQQLFVARMRRQGRNGGLARAKKLTPKERKVVAINAAKARWSKKG